MRHHWYSTSSLKVKQPRCWELRKLLWITAGVMFSWKLCLSLSTFGKPSQSEKKIVQVLISAWPGAKATPPFSGGSKILKTFYKMWMNMEISAALRAGHCCGDRLGELGLFTWRGERSGRSLQHFPIPKGIQESQRGAFDKDMCDRTKGNGLKLTENRLRLDIL